MAIDNIPQNLYLTNAEDGPEKRGISTPSRITPGIIIHQFIPDVRVCYNHKSILESTVGHCSFCNKEISSKRAKPSHPKQERSSGGKYNTSSTDPIYCSVCQVCYYCSDDCQRRDWLSVHRQECLYLSGRGKTDEVLPAACQALLRMYCLFTSSNTFRNRVKILTSHREFLEKDAEDEVVETLTQNVSELVFKVHDENSKLKRINKISVLDDLIYLCCVLIVNSTVFQNSFAENTGISFDTFFSLINHSCDPNCTLLTNYNQATLICLKEIKATSELTVNYCFVCLPKEIRQFELMKRFFFKCGCHICQEEFDRYFSYNCPNCSALACSLTFDTFFDDAVTNLKFKNYLSNSVCTSCKETINLDDLNKSSLIHQEIMIRYIELCNNEFKNEFNVDNNQETNKGENTAQIERLNFEELQKALSFYKTQLNKSDLIDLFVSANNNKSNLKYSHIELFQDLLKDAMTLNIIPLYCFPMTHIVAGLSEFYLQDKTNPLKTLKYNMILIFGCLIPVDTSSIKITIGNHLKELATIIAIVISDIKSNLIASNKEKKDFTVAPLLNVLIPLAVFFGLQSYSYLLNISHSSPDAPIVQDLVQLIAGMIRTGTSENEHLKNWFSTPFTDGKFSSILQKSIHILDLPINLERKIAFSDRTKKKILLTCSELDLANFGLKVSSPI